MKVFVTGASGFVGNYLLQALRDEGHKIKVLIRPGSEGKLPFVEGVDLVFGDSANPESYSGELSETDAVINLIGIIREFPAIGVTFRKLHVESTGNIVNAAKNAGVGRFIHMSANGADQNGVSGYQRTKWEAEQIVADSGMESIIFRPSVIFGDSAGKPEFTRQLADVIGKAPIMPIFGDGKYQLDPIAVTDIARVFTKAVTTPKATGNVYHLGGLAPLTFHEIIQQIGKAIRIKRTRTINIPVALIKPIAALLGGFASFPVTVDQLDMLTHSKPCPESEYRDIFATNPIAFNYKTLGYLAVR